MVPCSCTEAWKLSGMMSCGRLPDLSKVQPCYSVDGWQHVWYLAEELVCCFCWTNVFPSCQRDFSKLIHGFWKLFNRYVKIVTCVSRLLAIGNVWPRFLNQQSLQCKRGYESWGDVAWFLEYFILLQQSTPGSVVPLAMFFFSFFLRFANTDLTMLKNIAKKDPLLPVIIFEMAMQVAQN